MRTRSGFADRHRLATPRQVRAPMQTVPAGAPRPTMPPRRAARAGTHRPRARPTPEAQQPRRVAASALRAQKGAALRDDRLQSALPRPPRAAQARVRDRRPLARAQVHLAPVRYAASAARALRQLVPPRPPAM